MRWKQQILFVFVNFSVMNLVIGSNWLENEEANNMLTNYLTEYTLLWTCQQLLATILSTQTHVAQCPGKLLIMLHALFVLWVCEGH